MGLELSTAEALFEDRPLKAALLELGNAVIALFWLGDEPRLGTLTISMPGGVSSPLLGDRDRVLGQVIAERLAHLYGKMALVSINLPPDLGVSAGRVLLKLVGELVRER
ncbi:hypothetical protein CW701_00690 [Candidatus Bathyarchaeota archaeon]|nr:MAG: hypothetical protein CW701_00690 [Candidatus Bathyarchaeota archaeon]